VPAFYRCADGSAHSLRRRPHATLPARDEWHLACNHRLAMNKYQESRKARERSSDIRVALLLAAPFVVAMGAAAGCGSDSSPQYHALDTGVDQKSSPSDGPTDKAPATPDLPILDAPAERLVVVDGDSCQPPNVWRYQQPGCGADAHPVCGSAQQDAGLAFACGCNGERLTGFDYFDKPYTARGICPSVDGGTFPIDGPPDTPDAPPVSTDGPAPAIDGPIVDVPSEDGGSCPAPNVWRYQQPGCGADAHPVCGSDQQDAGLAFACGCDGEILRGFDYFGKPYTARGICTGACYSPTSYLESVPPLMGCACNAATDSTQCVLVRGGRYFISCVAGAWKLDLSTLCTEVDAGTSSIDGGGNG
jgi:hypothetical protein